MCIQHIVVNPLFLHVQSLNLLYLKSVICLTQYLYDPKLATFFCQRNLLPWWGRHDYSSFT